MNYVFQFTHYDFKPFHPEIKGKNNSFAPEDCKRICVRFMDSDKNPGRCGFLVGEKEQTIIIQMRDQGDCIMGVSVGDVMVIPKVNIMEVFEKKR